MRFATAPTASQISSLWVTKFALPRTPRLGTSMLRTRLPERFTGHSANHDAAPFLRLSNRMGVCSAAESVQRPRNVDQYPRRLTSSAVRIGAWSTDSPPARCSPSPLSRHSTLSAKGAGGSSCHRPSPLRIGRSSPGLEQRVQRGLRLGTRDSLAQLIGSPAHRLSRLRARGVILAFEQCQNSRTNPTREGVEGASSRVRL